jgi:glyoxylase I family protein
LRAGSGDDDMSEIIGYHHLGLSVTDLGKSVEWYRRVLRFEINAEIEGAGFRRTRLRTPSNGITLTLTVHDDESVEAFSERRPGMDHVAFQVGGRGDIDSLKGRLERLEVEHSEIKASGSGTAMITLRDPDNIQLEIFGGPFDPTIAAGGQETSS